MIIIVFYSSNKIKLVYFVLFYFVESTLFYSNKIKFIVLIRAIR